METSATIRKIINIADTIWSLPGYYDEADVRKIWPTVIIFSHRQFFKGLIILVSLEPSTHKVKNLRPQYIV